MSDRVLVALDRETAETWASPDSGLGFDAFHRASLIVHEAVKVALDTDREETVKAIARELYRQGVELRAAHAEDTAEAVLVLLENGGQE